MSEMYHKSWRADDGLLSYGHLGLTSGTAGNLKNRIRGQCGQIIVEVIVG